MSATLIVAAAGGLHAVGGASSAEPDAATPGATMSGASARTSPSPVQTGSQASRSDGREGAGGDGVVASGTADPDGSLPGVGPGMSAQIPDNARQLVLVAADATSATSNAVSLWERDSATSAWTQYGLTIIGRNGENGWTNVHREGDLASPVGVYTLTAAGGRLADPGTGMPYEYQPSFYRAPGGPSMANAFDYVVAIDYNRLPGQPPSDPNRPLGEAAGGDIWLHVDHLSPTRGCVSIPQDAMAAVLRWLSPSEHPVIVMGDLAALAS